MSEPLWIERDDINLIHDRQIAQHGGGAGTRDENLLLSALEAPRNHFAYVGDDLHMLAALYAHRIAKNHPFIDGNKRTAFLAAYAFPLANGMRVETTQNDVVVRTLALAAGEIDADAYAEWLRANSKPTA